MVHICETPKNRSLRNLNFRRYSDSLAVNSQACSSSLTKHRLYLDYILGKHSAGIRLGGVYNYSALFETMRSLESPAESGLFTQLDIVHKVSFMSSGGRPTIGLIVYDRSGGSQNPCCIMIRL